MTNTEPFRLRVKKAITAAIKSISVADGYTIDLADGTDPQGRPIQYVQRGREDFGEDDPYPLISVLEDPRALDPLQSPNGSGDRKGEWDLLIQGFVEDDEANPTDKADILVADVIKKLASVSDPEKNRTEDDFPNILGLGGRKPCVSKVDIGSPIVRGAMKGISGTCFFWLNVTLTLVEDVKKPYD